MADTIKLIDLFFLKNNDINVILLLDKKKPKFG